MKPSARKVGKIQKCKKMFLKSTYIRIIGRDEKGMLWDIAAEIRPKEKP